MHNNLLLEQTPHASAERVMAGLDLTPDYLAEYQPTYPNEAAVYDAVHELHCTQPATTPRHIDMLQDRLEAVVEKGLTPVAITARCAEPINARIPIPTMVAHVAMERAIVIGALGSQVVFTPRTGGQSTKPRSAGPKLLSDGTLLYPYMGDAVNGESEHERIPDPSRMVAMALQARDLRAGVEAVTGVQIPMAHEALLMPYEQSFVRIDPATGKQYLLSCELPWAGVRTNGLASAPIALLERVANPRGVKIGPTTAPGDIEPLVTKLNPEHVPGKLVFMMRTGPKNLALQAAILDAIKQRAPESVVMYDIHGITRPGEGGAKIRCVPELVADIQNTARNCGKAGLKLHGVHLESIMDHTRLECVDRPDQLPTHPGGVDPQLNPQQLAHVLGKVASYLL